MPGGQLAGFAFFVLLAFAALSSAIAGIEPAAAVLRERMGWSRGAAAAAAGGAMWFFGLAVVLSFNAWSDVRPLSGMQAFADLGIFELLDYASANLLLPIGAFLTCLFVAWRLPAAVVREEIGLQSGWLRAYRLIVGLICPLAILMMFVANL